LGDLVAINPGALFVCSRLLVAALPADATCVNSPPCQRHAALAGWLSPSARRPMDQEWTVEDMLSLTADDAADSTTATLRWSQQPAESPDTANYQSMMRWSQHSAESDEDGSARGRLAWTNTEDTMILHGVRLHGARWSKIAEMLPVARTNDAVRNRHTRLQRKRQRLPAQHAGPPLQQARALATDEQLGDSGVLMPPSSAAVAEDDAAASKHGDMWTEAEDSLIDTAVRHHKMRWKAIAAMLPARTESGCRNRWVRNMERARAPPRSRVAPPAIRSGC